MAAYSDLPDGFTVVQEAPPPSVLSAPPPRPQFNQSSTFSDLPDGFTPVAPTSIDGTVPAGQAGSSGGSPAAPLFQSVPWRTIGPGEPGYKPGAPDWQQDETNLSPADFAAFKAGKGQAAPGSSASPPPPSTVGAAPSPTLVSADTFVAPDTQPAPPQDAGAPSVAGGVLHRLGLGVRNVVEGAAAPLDPLYDLAAAPLRAVGVQIAPAAQNLDALLTAVGLPQPHTANERVTGDAVSGAAGVLPALVGGLPGVAVRLPTQAATLARALAAAPASQVVGGMAGGTAAGAAAENGAGPLTQALIGTAAGIGGAGLAGLPGAVRSGAAAVGDAVVNNMHTDAGRQQLAAQLLAQQAGGDPGALAATLRANAADPSLRLPGAPVTTAQASGGNTGLAQMEAGLRQQPVALPGGGTSQGVFAGVDQQRQAAQAAYARGLGNIPADASPADLAAANEARGATVRANLDAANDAHSAHVGRLYNRARAEEQVQAHDQAAAARLTGQGAPVGAHDISGVNDLAGNIGRDYYGPGSGGMPAALRGAVDDLAAQPSGRANADFLRRMDRRLGDIAGTASRAGDNTLASVAGRLRAAVQDVGSTPELDVAKAARRAQGEKFGTNAQGAKAVGAVLAHDKFGNPNLPDAKVMDRVIADAPSVRQALEASYDAADLAARGGTPAEAAEMAQRAKATRQAARDAFATRLFDKVRKPGDGIDAADAELSATRLNNFLRQNEGVARELFTPEQQDNIRLLARDMQEVQDTAEAGKVAGASTARNLSIGTALARVARGSRLATLAAKGADAAMLAGLVHVAKELHIPFAEEAGEMAPALMMGGAVKHGAGFASAKLAHAREQASAVVRQLVTDAMADPELAAHLLENLTPQNLARLRAHVAARPPLSGRAGVAMRQARQSLNVIEDATQRRGASD